MFKFKYILWFFYFIGWCIRDLVKYPIECFNNTNLLHQNFIDLKTKIIFDSDKKYFHYSRYIKKTIDKKHQHR
jgi:hypothetical protein